MDFRHQITDMQEICKPYDAQSNTSTCAEDADEITTLMESMPVADSPEVAYYSVIVSSMIGRCETFMGLHEDMQVCRLCALVGKRFEIPDFAVRLMCDEKVIHMSDAMTLGMAGVVEGSQLLLVKNFGWARPDLRQLTDMEKQWRGRNIRPTTKKEENHIASTQSVASTTPSLVQSREPDLVVAPTVNINASIDTNIDGTGLLAAGPATHTTATGPKVSEDTHLVSNSITETVKPEVIENDQCIGKSQMQAYVEVVDVIVNTMTGRCETFKILPSHFEDMQVSQLCALVAKRFEIPDFAVRLMCDDKVIHMSDAMTLRMAGIFEGSQLLLVKNFGWAKPDLRQL